MSSRNSEREKLKSKLTYKGPLALYASYYVLFALAVCLTFLSFRVERESDLFVQLLATGIAAAAVSLTMILYSTQIERKIHPVKWRKKVEGYYQDEGIFEYTHDGFTIIKQGGKSLHVPWKGIERAESGESQLNKYIRKFHINIFLSEADYFTVDSTMPGFHLFEQRLKQNLRGIVNKEPAAGNVSESEEQKVGIS